MDNPTATDTDNTAVAVQEQQPAQEAKAASKSDAKPEMSIEDYKAALAKANAEAAKHRVERNEYREDAEKYRKIREAEKTDLQRAQEALEAERAKSKQFQVELARSQALAKYGISEDNADLLGSDPAKFEVNAQKLGALQAEAAKKAAPPSDYPIEALKPGASAPVERSDFNYPSHWPVKGQFTK